MAYERELPQNDFVLEAFDAKLADEAEYERALELADRDFQRFELAMTWYEYDGVHDLLNEHLNQPVVYDLEAWLKVLEANVRAGEYGWPTISIPQGKVVVEIDREALRDNFVFIRVYGLRRMRRPSTHSPAELERIARELIGDDVLFYPGDGYADHIHDDHDIFDDYEGPENPRVVEGFDHPATGGGTGLLSNWHPAATDRDVEAWGPPGGIQRVRASVDRGRRV